MYLLLTVLAVQQPASRPAPPVSDTAHVVIVATTDVHGRVLGWDYVRDAAAPGGLSRAATMVETLRAQYPEQVVLVDAGDLIEGNLFAAYFAERDSQRPQDRKSTRLNSSHLVISYAVFCLKKKK